jgi:hypothetical protein
MTNLKQFKSKLLKNPKFKATSESYDLGYNDALEDLEKEMPARAKLYKIVRKIPDNYAYFEGRNDFRIDIIDLIAKLKL